MSLELRLDELEHRLEQIEAEWGERIGKKKVAALRAALEELSLLPALVLPRAA